MKVYTIKQIVENPVQAYKDFHQRILTYGANAPFPEFKASVDAIITALKGERFAAVLNEHPDLLMECHEVMTFFTHINLSFFFDDNIGNHPYQIPFHSPYPYRPTLEAIEMGLRLLDKLNRLEPGNRAVPFYHFDRYAYHKFGIFGNPDVIIMPVAEEIDFYDLLRVRSVPIGFLGVVTETIRVDRHWQSPVDFWFHDINHVRRMTEYFKQRIAQQGITTTEGKYDFYEQMDCFIKEKILPCIKAYQQEKSTNPANFAMRKMVQILIFEVVHESALTIEPEVIIKEILREAGPQPFEHMVTEEASITDIEKFRTPTGNISSGSSVVEANPLNTLRIRYFWDRSLGLLSTVYNKLNFGFYDDPEHPNSMVVPVEFRDMETLMEATFIVLRDICGMRDELIPSNGHILELITDRRGSHEKYVYKGVLVDEGKNANIGSYATDPQPVKPIIKEVYGLNKKVVLLMGYAELGYQDEAAMLKAVRSKLSELDPATHVVCSGATAQGIGKAYQVAKDMGFETIGIVSTLALSSAGSFSPFVDRIYIVNDNQWGGYIPGTHLAAPTTRAFLEVADIVLAIGGGNNTAALLSIATKQYPDIKLTFVPADMNHKKADKHGLDRAGSASKVSLARTHSKK
jgi:hypothetical protein